MYPFKQSLRDLGSAILIDFPSTDTVGIYLLEKEEGIEKKKQAFLVSLSGVKNMEYKASITKLQSQSNTYEWQLGISVLIFFSAKNYKEWNKQSQVKLQTLEKFLYWLQTKSFNRISHFKTIINVYAWWFVMINEFDQFYGFAYKQQLIPLS